MVAERIIEVMMHVCSMIRKIYVSRSTEVVITSYDLFVL